MADSAAATSPLATAQLPGEEKRAARSNKKDKEKKKKKKKDNGGEKKKEKERRAEEEGDDGGKEVLGKTGEAAGQAEGERHHKSIEGRFKGEPSKEDCCEPVVRAFTTDGSTTATHYVCAAEYKPYGQGKDGLVSRAWIVHEVGSSGDEAGNGKMEPKSGAIHSFASTYRNNKKGFMPSLRVAARELLRNDGGAFPGAWVNKAKLAWKRAVNRKKTLTAKEEARASEVKSEFLLPPEARAGELQAVVDGLAAGSHPSCRTEGECDLLASMVGEAGNGAAWKLGEGRGLTKRPYRCVCGCGFKLDCTFSPHVGSWTVTGYVGRESTCKVTPLDRQGEKVKSSCCNSGFKPRQLVDTAVVSLSQKGAKSCKEGVQKVSQHCNFRYVKRLADAAILKGTDWDDTKLLQPAMEKMKALGGGLVIFKKLGSGFRASLREARKEKHERQQGEKSKKGSSYIPVPFNVDDRQHCEDLSKIEDTKEYVCGWVLVTDAAVRALKTKGACFGDVWSADACHKVGLDPGTLYNIVTRDANNCNFAVALAHFIGHENKGRWTQVFEAVKGVLAEKGVSRSPRVVISDRDKGLKGAIAAVFPSCVPFFCRVHLEKNIKANCTFASATFYNKCFFALTRVTCLEHLEEWKGMDRKGYDYAKKAAGDVDVSGCPVEVLGAEHDGAQFAVLFPALLKVPLYGVFDNNPSEQYWSKSMDVRTAVGFYRTLEKAAGYLCSSYSKRKAEAMGAGGLMVPRYSKLVTSGRAAAQLGTMQALFPEAGNGDKVAIQVVGFQLRR